MLSWGQLPPQMQTEAVRPYYEYLRKKKLSLALKRAFDIVASTLLLLLLSPVILVLAIWIKCDSKGPVFYRQERVTRYGKTFRIFKFRTMVSGADRLGSLVTVKGDSRITRVGEKIRHGRLDELPQLLNIWKGEMSFVGTRPEVPKYVEAYTDEMWATLLLPAGVTSLASLEFKDEDSILSEYMEQGLTTDEAYVLHVLPEKMQLNLESVRKFSLQSDIGALFKTVREVLHK